MSCCWEELGETLYRRINCCRVDKSTGEVLYKKLLSPVFGDPFEEYYYGYAEDGSGLAIIAAFCCQTKFIILGHSTKTGTYVTWVVDMLTGEVDWYGDSGIDVVITGGVARPVGDSIYLAGTITDTVTDPSDQDHTIKKIVMLRADASGAVTILGEYAPDVVLAPYQSPFTPYDDYSAPVGAKGVIDSTGKVYYWFWGNPTGPGFGSDDQVLWLGALAADGSADWEETHGGVNGAPPLHVSPNDYVYTYYEYDSPATFSFGRIDSGTYVEVAAGERGEINHAFPEQTSDDGDNTWGVGGGYLSLDEINTGDEVFLVSGASGFWFNDPGNSSSWINLPQSLFRNDAGNNENFWYANSGDLFVTLDDGGPTVLGPLLTLSINFGVVDTRNAGGSAFICGGDSGDNRTSPHTGSPQHPTLSKVSLSGGSASVDWSVYNALNYLGQDNDGGLFCAGGGSFALGTFDSGVSGIGVIYEPDVEPVP